jgi:hypothetical protein
MSTGGHLMCQLIDLADSLCGFIHQLHGSKFHTMLQGSLMLFIVLLIVPRRVFEAQWLCV